MYRPEGLENPHSDVLPFTREENIAQRAFEAGANAECAGIIKKIESMPHSTTHCDILRALRGEDEYSIVS